MPVYPTYPIPANIIPGGPVNREVNIVLQQPFRKPLGKNVLPTYWSAVDASRFDSPMLATHMHFSLGIKIYVTAKHRHSTSCCRGKTVRQARQLQTRVDRHGNSPGYMLRGRRSNQIEAARLLLGLPMQGDCAVNLEVYEHHGRRRSKPFSF